MEKSSHAEDLAKRDFQCLADFNENILRKVVTFRLDVLEQGYQLLFPSNVAIDKSIDFAGIALENRADSGKIQISIHGHTSSIPILSLMPVRSHAHRHYPCM
jgi:hypothetical protein